MVISSPDLMSLKAISDNVWSEDGNVITEFGMQLWLILLCVTYKADPSLFRN